ncbi:MAG TPA: hypothetical protein VNO52_10150 [Methylomirabilota bacterium]|nr:hypothetical protein [Methylomirabilota bacterium]
MFGVITASAQTTTQTFQLRNGWNSIWLEVQPTNAEISVVFAGLPVSSVWTYVPAGAVQFIQDQSEDLFNQPGWLPYFPASRPEAFLTKLHTVNALRPYLVKLTNGPRTLTVTGRPVVRAAKWVADSFNLRGFPVNPAQLPTFATFFSPSAAHAGQRIYQLRDNGQWTLVNAGDTMKHGEAYWAFCRGASTYQGPLGFTLEPGDGLDYGTLLNEIEQHYKNESPGARVICLQDLRTGANTPLSYQDFLSNRLTWVNLPAPRCFTLDGGATLDGLLAMRRRDFAGTNYGSILEVKDDIGTRYLVSVTAGKLTAARRGLNLPPPTGAAELTSGLWVGTATVTNVNEVNSSRPTNGAPTRSPFDLRLLVHVDAGGKPYLLKEVIQMWQNGTTTNDAQGRAVTDKPGRYVLLTDDSLLPAYRGASLRDGTSVGRRISTVDYDFDGGASNVLAMTGAFGIGNTARATLVLEPDAPTNPFKHTFHPDHDNLDPAYRSFKEEAYRVTRQVELEFTAQPASALESASAAIEYGYSVLGGVYRETVSGLHRMNIVASGTFRLTRVNNSPVLNQ